MHIQKEMVTFVFCKVYPLHYKLFLIYVVYNSVKAHLSMQFIFLNLSWHSFKPVRYKLGLKNYICHPKITENKEHFYFSIF